MALRAAGECEDAVAHRIKMKIGDAEFEAEGTEESVQAQYERFVALVERRPASAVAAPVPSIVGAPAAIPAATANGDDQSVQLPFDGALMSRIFELRPDGVVALKVLPKGQDKESDALLLLLYGYRKLKNEEQVLTTQLLRASKFSGVDIYRPAHALAQYDEFLIRGGQRKGTTYSLNNPGLLKAEEIAMRMFP